jgi:signal transduction histidine kinase/DNA-binding response OmpR family regulator/ligand-binding sensor domain-containing protein
MIAPEGLLAQDEFSIDLLDVKKGLLSNFVTKTISDDKQFKYFATEGGISRYDGYQFKHYRPEPGSSGLANENIETIFYSKAGFIWIGTKTGGLSRLNVKTQALENWNEVFSSFSNKPLRIVSLTEDIKGNIWVGTFSGGCFKVDPATKKVMDHFPSNRTIFNLICDAQGTVWFTDGMALCAYKNEDGSLQRFIQPFNAFNICEDTARKRIWVVGNIDGDVVKLSYYDQMQGTITEVPMNLKARFVSSIAIDQKMRLWLGSWGNGLYVSDPAVSKFQKINTSGFNSTTRNTNYNGITHIYIDPNGIAWLSTSYGGVLILYPNKGFRNLTNNQNTEERDYNITAISNNLGNGLLAGSIAYGLYSVGDPLQPAFNRNMQVPATRINQIYKQSDRYFLATNAGLYIFSQGLQSPPKRYFPTEKITSVLLSSTNHLWVGTQQHGIQKMKFDQVPDTANITSFTSFSPPPFQIDNDRINKMVEDKYGNLWLATHSGINLWDEKTQRFLSHSTLFGGKFAGVIVHDILVTGDKIFIATPNGLFNINLKQPANTAPTLEVAAHYNEGGVLVNQFICALQEDRNGNIWFSSTTGIAKLNIHNGVLHHFGKQDGVQVNAFHITSSFSDSKGILYFGGDNGLVFFNPEAVIANYQKPSVVLTGISINNQPIGIETQGNSKQILTQAIPYTSNLSLGYKYTDIAFQFAANDFLGTENIRYAYKLNPDNKTWILLRDENEVSFTGLNPGNYKLAIRANRNNQGWGDPTEITLQIAYPPWLSWYAWFFYVLLGVGIVMAIRKFRMRQEKLKIELQRVQFEKEKEHEINEAKITFFTNISHEFRTPLTLILSPCTELLADNKLTSPELQKITLVKSNAQKLLRLINQLLDFRKSEHGLLSMRAQEEDIIKLVRGLLYDFAPAAKAKNISLSLETEAAELSGDIDRPQMEMAINNLISNAIKFTPANGRVSVHLHADGHFFILEVRDNGIGIESWHLEKVFNRFYQVPSTGGQLGGSGIGLAFVKNIIELHNGTISVESEAGKGATFRIRLPIRQTTGKSPDITTDNLQMDEALVAALPQTVKGGASSSKQSILIVDDNDDIRVYLAGLLKGEFEVLEAENGSVGHKIALDVMPDLIISDVMMPQMNGIDLCKELKNNMATSHIPIMLLTARASEAYELNGLQTGADDYITKPFNPLIVQMRVRNILENRKKLKAYYLKKVRFEPDACVEVAENLDEIFLKKAIDLVNANLQNENLGIEMMVDHLFMSQSTLFRKIKSLTGLSITGFIRALRIKKAAQLILHSNMKMSDVAFEVGFNDYKYFKKSFQQQFECLPSEYREKQAEDQQT